MPIHKIDITDTYVRLFVSSNRDIQLNYADFSLDQPAEREKFRLLLQGFMEVRQRLNTLPRDDPDRDTDPALPYLFWDGPGQPGNTFLVGRCVEVGEITWDGTRADVPLKRLN